MRALRAVAIRPSICHMNEGHSAFLGLERARMTMEELGVLHSSAQLVAAGNVFTTLRQCPRFDLFDPGLMESISPIRSATRSEP